MFQQIVTCIVEGLGRNQLKKLLLFSKSLFSFPKLFFFVLNSNATMERNGLTSLKLLENSNDFMLYVQFIFDELFIVGNSNHSEMKSFMFMTFFFNPTFGLNNIYSNIILHIQFTWFMVQDLIKS